MAFRLESKPVATYDENHNLTEWKPHFILGWEKDMPVPMVHKKKSEILIFLNYLKEHQDHILREKKFRIVVTGSHGDTAIIPLEL